MAKIKQKADLEIEVDGEPYIWRLQRQPQWSRNPAECHGKAIAVRHAEGQREAVIEFPLGREPRYGAPMLKPSQIPQDLVARAIRSAMAAGWDPLSRGKTVSILVDETGG